MNKIIKTLIPLIIFLTAFLAAFFVGRAFDPQDTKTDAETPFVNNVPVISDTPGEEIMNNIDPGLPPEYFF